MALKPRAGDRGERESKKEQVERPLHGFRRDAHPARNLPRIRLGVNHPPQHAHHNEREYGHSQRLVELAIEIAGGRIYALFGSSRTVDVREHDEDRSDPMEGLGDVPVADERALLHFVTARPNEAVQKPELRLLTGIDLS